MGKKGDENSKTVLSPFCGFIGLFLEIPLVAPRGAGRGSRRCRAPSQLSRRYGHTQLTRTCPVPGSDHRCWLFLSLPPPAVLPSPTVTYHQDTKARTQSHTDGSPVRPPAGLGQRWRSFFSRGSGVGRATLNSFLSGYFFMPCTVCTASSLGSKLPPLVSLLRFPPAPFFFHLQIFPPGQWGRRPCTFFAPFCTGLDLNLLSPCNTSPHPPVFLPTFTPSRAGTVFVGNKNSLCESLQLFGSQFY